MISYEEAKKIADELKPNCDSCVEFTIAFMFKKKEEEFNIGGDMPCVILKENGRAINTTEFYDNYDVEEIREFDIA